MTRTQWFFCTTKPAHIGWYECRYADSKKGFWMRYWNGQYWTLNEKLDHIAFFGEVGDRWRGLTKEAK